MEPNRHDNGLRQGCLVRFQRNIWRIVNIRLQFSFQWVHVENNTGNRNAERIHVQRGSVTTFKNVHCVGVFCYWVHRWSLALHSGNNFAKRKHSSIISLIGGYKILTYQWSYGIVMGRRLESHTKLCRRQKHKLHFT